ncbi:MAG: Xaa-Pro peptidase family protein [Thermodesulfobacteriota bacterium]|nr:Xaa-Pro peptidase family protein [Thermodesulfobacteriota bacterium]
MNLSETAYVPETEIAGRIDKLKQRLSAAGLDGVLIMQSTDLFYFSGTAQQAFLYVPADNDPLLMVKRDVARARAESPLAQLVHLKSVKIIPEMIGPVPSRLGLAFDVIPAAQYRMICDLFPNTDVADLSHDIRTIRAVKSEYEQAIIRQAAEMSDKVAAFVPTVLAEGMTEIELAGQIEAEARRLGHQGLIRMRTFGGELFYGHVMSGASAAVPSYLASPTGGPGTTPAFPQGSGTGRLKANEPVLVDMAFAYRGYISDHTRIYALKGLPDDLLTGHAAMLDVQKTVRQAAKPGVTTGSLYDTAVARAHELGYSDYFMGAQADRIRFVGHGVGLELDEYPVLARGQTMALIEGMVIALEPKLIFPGRGVVGIENTHIVTRDGLEQLGRFQENVIIV